MWAVDRWFTNIGEIVQSSVIRKTWNEGTMEYWWRREGLAWKRSACQVSQGDCLRTTQGSIIYIPTNHSGGAGKSSLATTQGAYLHVTPLFLSNSLCNVLLMRGSGRRREGLPWERRACKISQGDCPEPKQPDSWYIKYQTLLGKKKENWPTWDRAGKSSLAIRQDSYLHVRPLFLSLLMLQHDAPNVSIYRPMRE